jgi:hypothetical protein
MQSLIVLPDYRRELTGFERAAMASVTQRAQVHCKSLRLSISEGLPEINSARSIDGDTYRPGA